MAVMDEFKEEREALKTVRQSRNWRISGIITSGM